MSHQVIDRNLFRKCFLIAASCLPPFSPFPSSLRFLTLFLMSRHAPIKSSKKDKSSESVQCAILKACDACADMGQLKRTVPIRKTFRKKGLGSTAKCYGEIQGEATAAMHLSYV